MVRYIPCAYNDNKGEQVARNFLMSSLAGSDGILLGNYHLPVDNSTLECDLVLFNNYGVWIIEVKNWHGTITIDQINWKLENGQIHLSPLSSVENKAKKLHTLLKNAGFWNISVTGFVILTQKNAKLLNEDREPHADKIFRLDDRLIRALTDRKYLHRSDNREMDIDFIEQIVDDLLPRAIGPGQERIGDSYRILYNLGPGPEGIFHAYQAAHLTIPARYARAKKYFTTTAFDTGNLRDAINSFQRDMQALARIKYHPNIVQVYDYLPDRESDDTYWLLLEWIEGINLQDRIEIDLDISYQEQMQILSAILDALDYCHNQGILHRNLTPSCIYLANDGKIKLGDFDFARVPELPTMLNVIGQTLPVSVKRYTAPELQTDARSADARSDLYALGAIWYDMIVRPEAGERIDLSRLEKVDLSADARDLLVRLLSPDPDERPRSARAVKRWLEQI